MYHMGVNVHNMAANKRPTNFMEDKLNIKSLGIKTENDPQNPNLGLKLNDQGVNNNLNDPLMDPNRNKLMQKPINKVRQEPFVTTDNRKLNPKELNRKPIIGNTDKAEPDASKLKTTAIPVRKISYKSIE